jgi:hypothetical protein
LEPRRVLPYAFPALQARRMPHVTLLGLLLCAWPWVSPLVWSWAVSLGIAATKGNADRASLLRTGVGAIGLVLVCVGYKLERRTARPLATTVAFALGLALAVLPTIYFVVVFFLFVVVAR